MTKKAGSPPPPTETDSTAVEGTTFTELFAHVLEASFATFSSVSRVRVRPWGAIFVAPDYPAVHDANMAWVERIPKSGISQVLLELDGEMRSHGISFRRLEFADPDAAYDAQEALVGLDFAPTRGLAMVRLGESACVRNPDLMIREADTPEEWAVFDAVLSEIHAESGFSAEVSRELVKRYHARRRKLGERMYIGLLGGVGAGAVTLVPRNKIAFIAEVGTRPTFRRRGVARTLVEEVSSIGLQMGIPYVGLSTAWENEAARALYETLGYRPVGELRGFLKT